jgi:hypothetical protein
VTRHALDSLVLVAALALVATVASAQSNRTPGDDKDAESDHTAFVFGAYDYIGFTDYPAYVEHVCSGGSTGQQYEYSAYIEYDQPNPSPQVCTVASFYDLIHNNKTTLGTLLISGHGDTGVIIVEPFGPGAAGYAAALARYIDYLNGDVTGVPVLTQAEIGLARLIDHSAIYIKSAFITNHADMPDSLVFNSTCFGSTLNGDWVAAGCRVSLGFNPEVGNLVAIAVVREFFERMDGQVTIEERPVEKAKAGLAQLFAAGKENTTLAPAVTEVIAPCPIEVGDVVIYLFDTECDMDVIPNIMGSGVTIENETWSSPTELIGVCTDVEDDGEVYSLTLDWGQLYSGRNDARLDGNTEPYLINARGKAHDHHKSWYECLGPCIGDINGDGVVDIGDLLALLDNWGDLGIGDLLDMLDNWNSDCPKGACCIWGYCIEDVNPADCQAADGMYYGDDSTCSSIICPELGACCFEPFICLESWSDTECTAAGGLFLGVSSECLTADCNVDPRGACCHADGSCTEFTLPGECTNDGDIWLGVSYDCTSCQDLNPVGACCVASGSDVECIQVSLVNCALQGGDFYGIMPCDDMQCLPVGSCCVPVGDTPSCMDSFLESWCIDGGGEWNEGESCEDIDWDCSWQFGACCLTDDWSCTDDLSESECIALNGEWHGSQFCTDSPCMGPSGACCMPDGSCIAPVSQGQCSVDGGTFYEGVGCEDTPCGSAGTTGACCYYDWKTMEYVCVDATELECMALAGDHWPDQSCAEIQCF